jgi:hypothetical protein
MGEAVGKGFEFGHHAFELAVRSRTMLSRSAVCDSRNACASRSALMSRAILDAPITWPSSSRMGEIVSETGTSVPSLRTRIVEK